MLDILKTYSVTELNTEINSLLSQSLISVQGEISDFKIIREKFVYFDIKDESSKISCFMMLFSIKTPIEDGMEVKITGKVGVYIPGGKLTFRVENISPIGEGALRRALELTRKKLETEGLFDSIFKQPLPRFPQKIGIISALGAAAYTDVLKILQNRWAGLEIFLKPTLVQGENAPNEIVSAIEYYNKYHPVDVIILTRGGGSLEDLSAFNSEEICRAVFASKIPIIVGVGHERDETLVELVADTRASTPSNAAELVVADKKEWIEKLEKIKIDLILDFSNKINEFSTEITNLSENLKLSLVDLLGNNQENIASLVRLLKTLSPGKKVYETSQKINFVMSRLTNQILINYNQKRESLFSSSRILESLNPQIPLQRGYSLSYINGKLIKTLDDVKITDKIETKLKKGSIISEVLEMK